MTAAAGVAALIALADVLVIALLMLMMAG